MKRLVITLCILLMGFFSYGQTLKEFEVFKIKNNETHSCEDREEFQAIFRCSKKINLHFSSDSDKDGDVQPSCESTANENIYRINFPAHSKKYKNRVLTIEAAGFSKVRLPRFNFGNHETVEYSLRNPYDKEDNPFYRSQAQGDSLMGKFNYDEAHNAYSRCKMFPEYKEESNKHVIDKQLEKIDSIQSWRQMGDKYMENMRYKDAARMFKKIYDEIPDDPVSHTKWNESMTKFDSYCSEYMSQAESHFKNHEYKKAKEFYQNIINMQCGNAQTAREQIRLCDAKINARMNHNHFILWEFGLKDNQADYPNMALPLGITIGNCRPRRGGGYWSVRTHMDAFKMINTLNREKEHGLKSEANMSVGGTGHIYAPGGMKPGLWYHIGLGYTGCGIDLDETSDKDRYKWKHAVSPEAGLIFKWTYFALKYTFQYRGWIQGDKVEMMNPADTEVKLSSMRHYISVGVAW